MEIYVDVLFFINFFMDFVILYLTNVVSKMNKSIKRLLAASVIMAFMYCIFSLNFLYKYGNIFQLIIMALMVVIVFMPADFYTYIRIFIINIINSLAVGGITLVLYFFNGYGFVLRKNTISVFPFSLLICGVSTAVTVILLYNTYINNKILKGEKICNIILYLGHKSVEIRALVDTGNSLQDPISGKPVIIVDKNIVMQLIKGNKICGIRLLPYKSLGNSNGILKGIIIDKAVVECKEIYKPIIGIYNEKLSNNSFFNGLISPKLYNGGYYD